MTSDAAKTEELDIVEEVEPDQYLVFTVRSQEFGFQAMRVQEISRVLPVTTVPNAPMYIEGVTNLRGRLATIMNFRRKFGFQSAEDDEDTRTIVIELGGSPIGITVDSVEEVVRIPDETVQSMPMSTAGRAAREYMRGVGMLGSRLIILLDVDKVLTETELVDMGAIARAVTETVSPTPSTVEESTDALNRPADKSTVAVADKPTTKPPTAKRRNQ